MECQGPCNPRNRTCRPSCMKNMVSILQELPPCIRMRLCQEDLFSVFGKPPRDPTVSNLQDSATTSEDLRAVPEKSREESRGEKREIKEVEPARSCEDKTSQTERRRRGRRPVSISLDASSISSYARSAFVVIKGGMVRAARALRGMGLSGCSCRIINAMIYTSVLLLLAVFAWPNQGFQLFLSSQLCGIIAILCWRISGNIPL